MTCRLFMATLAVCVVLTAVPSAAAESANELASVADDKLGQADREGQAEPGAVMLARPRRCHLAETHRRNIDLIGVHTDAAVLDGNHQAVLVQG